jgi:hypothetical protein
MGRTNSDGDEWDQQIEEDFSPAGFGTALLEEAEAGFREGRVKSVDEFLATASARRNAQPQSQS